MQQLKTYLDDVTTGARFAPPRRDGAALGFGVAFLALAALALLKSGGLHVPTAWLYAAVLIGLGLAGLVSARWRT